MILVFQEEPFDLLAECSIRAHDMAPVAVISVQRHFSTYVIALRRLHHVRT